MNRATLPKIERNLFLPALAGFFIAGIWLATRVSAGLWPLWLLLPAVLMLWPLHALRLPPPLALLPVALVLGLFWTQHWLNPSMPAAGTYESITAIVYGDSKVNDSGNVTFRLVDVSLEGKAQQGKAYAIIYTSYGDDPVALTDGMQIRFSGTVYKPYAKQNEYDFDFPMWMRQNGLRYGITSIKDIEILSAETHWTNYAQRMAKLCHAKLQTVMGDQADLAVAMLLGYRDALAEDDAAAFQRAGVAHVMVVSGLHVGILSMALIWLLERLRLRKKRQVPVVAVFLLLYCGITGFAVASVRAAVTVFLWVLAKAFGRKPNSISVISAALVIVLFINPLQLYSAGFAMSFAAIAGIALLYPRFLRVMEHIPPTGKQKKSKTPRYWVYQKISGFKKSAAVSLSAQLGVGLPIATYYHHIYFCGLIFNLIIIPIVSVLVPLYAVTLLVLFIPWFGGWLGAALGWAAGLGSKVVLWLVRLSGLLAWANLRVPEPSVWVYLAYFLCMLTVSHFVRATLRKRLIIIIVVIVVAAGGMAAQQAPSLRYHQFAVGWADSALIVDGNTTIGIDTGSTGDAMINRLLAENRNLDALILTHLHSDHAGGVQAILDEGIVIHQVYLPVDYEKQDYTEESLAIVQALEDAGVPITCVAAGDTLTFRETTIDILWPEANSTRTGIDANDRSLAMLITLGNVRILSMADNGLYENYTAISADILKVGHHGSKTGTSEAFLDVVEPTLALISVRADTAAPAQVTLDRLAAEDVRVLRTDETGEITIVPGTDGYRAYQFLAEDTP